MAGKPETEKTRKRKERKKTKVKMEDHVFHIYNLLSVSWISLSSHTDTETVRQKRRRE